MKQTTLPLPGSFSPGSGKNNQCLTFKIYTMAQSIFYTVLGLINGWLVVEVIRLRKKISYLKTMIEEMED